MCAIQYSEPVESSVLSCELRHIDGNRPVLGEAAY